MLLPCYQNHLIEAGCDEAGRGCLAGPVVAAAVVLGPGFDNSEIDDSKKLGPAKRNKLRYHIESNCLSWAVGFVDNKTIDHINILKASFMAMHQAIEKLEVTPEVLLIDGNRFDPYLDMIHHCIVGGDGKYLAIAAASILAKTHRDEFMEKQAHNYPGYGWESNKGYPTRFHREAIRGIGITPLHRKTFRLLPDQRTFL